MKEKGKFMSRKFWMTVVAAAVGIAQLFIADDGISTVIGAVLTLVPSVIYVITEGKLDAKKFNEAIRLNADEEDRKESK